MGRLLVPSYEAVRDTREHEGYGWIFEAEPPTKHPPLCKGMISEKLDTGDYSVKGMEDLLSIERKQDFSEMWTAFFSKGRFEQEIERMTPIKYKFVLVETILGTDLLNLSPASCRRTIPGKVVLDWIIKIQMEYNVPIMFVGECGQATARYIMRNTVLREKDRWDALQ